MRDHACARRVGDRVLRTSGSTTIPRTTGPARASAGVSVALGRVPRMSVNIHLTLCVDKLESLAEAEAVKGALAEVLREHGLDGQVNLRKFREPISVKVTTGKWPFSVRGFGAWSETFEKDVKEAVGGAAPAAVIDLEWGYPDYD